MILIPNLGGDPSQKLKTSELFSASLKARVWQQSASKPASVISDSWCSHPCESFSHQAGLSQKWQGVISEVGRELFGSCLVFCLGSGLTLGKAACRTMSTLKQHYGEVHVVRNWDFLPLTIWVGCRGNMFYSLVRPWMKVASWETPSQSHSAKWSWIPDSHTLCEVINVCCLTCTVWG